MLAVLRRLTREGPRSGERRKRAVRGVGLLTMLCGLAVLLTANESFLDAESAFCRASPAMMLADLEAAGVDYERVRDSG